MRITAGTDVDKVKPQDMPRFTAIFLAQVVEALNGNLSFSDNLNAKLLTVTFTAANADVATIHGLGRVPAGYFVVGRTAAMIVYDGSSTNTSSLLYLRSSVAGTARIWVY